MGLVLGYKKNKRSKALTIVTCSPDRYDVTPRRVHVVRNCLTHRLDNVEVVAMQMEGVLEKLQHDRDVRRAWRAHRKTSGQRDLDGAVPRQSIDRSIRQELRRVRRSTENLEKNRDIRWLELDSIDQMSASCEVNTCDKVEREVDASRERLPGLKGDMDMSGFSAISRFQDVQHRD